MENDWRDHPAAVRPGEELDLAPLREYLMASIPGLEGELVIEQFPKGYSNLTYLLRFGERELVLRRPPFGAKIKSAHDMGREHHILTRLIDVYPKVPRTLLYCEDETIIGAPFYVMTRLEGIILRPQMPAEGIPPAATMRGIAASFIDNLVELHTIDYQAAGLGNLGRPSGYIRRQIDGWTRRYTNARTDDISEMEHVASWLAGYMPQESAASLIHNDYKYDNLVLDPADWTKIVGVLDWEMATIGDPLMDLGTSLGYWVEKDDPEEIRSLRLSPTDVPGNPSREELVRHYSEKRSQELPDIIFYYVYGLFKLAVIVQQIYYRYERGYTQDKRFATLIHAVRACSQMAVAAINKGRMNQLL